MKLITIEGNIGSGKSTILTKLKEYYKDNNNIIFIDEPLMEWQNMKDENDKNLLEHFYEDNEKYSFPFQIYAYITILNKLFEAHNKNPNAILISERGVKSTMQVFAKMLYDNKKINEIMYKIYKELCNFGNTQLLQLIPNLEHKMIYIDTNPEVCLERIKSRSRIGETIIAIDYLVLCKKYHDEMMRSATNNQEIVLYFDGNINYHSNKNCYDIIFEFVNYYVKESEIITKCVNGCGEDLPIEYVIKKNMENLCFICFCKKHSLSL